MSHYSLTPAQAERLEMLAEEAGEVVQAVTKILRHGFDSSDPTQHFYRTNRTHLAEELQELNVVHDEMIACGDLFTGTTRPNSEVWRRKLAYTHHQGFDHGIPRSYI